MPTKNKNIEVSIILTGYNEGNVLWDNLVRVKTLLSETKYSWEIILYDDASTDGTLATFRKFAKRYKNVKCYFNRYNIGRGGTVKKAIRKSKGKYVGYIDTDLELSPIYLFEFIRVLKENSDVAIARRIYAIGFSNMIRGLLSRGYVFLVHFLLDVKLHDTEAGFKFFNRKKIIPILSKVKDDRWFFDTEIVVRSIWEGLVVKEIPVVYIYNVDKASSVDLINDSILYFKKLLAFRKERNK